MLVSANPARTYPRVLPASLPSVSEPDRNQGGSLVLPGLELLPVPEPVLNFELETKDGRSVINLQSSYTGPKMEEKGKKKTNKKNETVFISWVNRNYIFPRY